MAKPKKALRGLFARTEPNPTEDVTPHRSIKKALGIRETPVIESNEEEIEEASLTPVIESTSITETEDVTSHQSPEEEPVIETPIIVEAAPAIEESLAVEATHATEVAPAPEAAAVLEANPIVEATINIEPAVEVAIEMTPASVAIPVVTNEVHNANVAAAVANIQYNFNLSREDRETWAENEYIECIRRIDVAQAEAFFLKGKLLGEVKDRFYQENKTGWKTFAEGALGMNYTTVNQYIRVSQEFDVASHRRPDFGFEHYKALLPLKVDERVKLLGELPQVSVKELRNIVQRKLLEDGISVQRPQRTMQSKELIELLISLKTKIFDCTPETMDQKERWQLTAACRNLADDLTAVARHLNDFGKRGTDTTPRAAETIVEMGV